MPTVRNLIAGTVVIARLVAMAGSEVVVNEVVTGNPWSTITVTYTLGGVDADLNYKVAFDVTANGVTKGVTNVAAKLTDGVASQVIDTATLFGTAIADPKAKVCVSLIVVKPKLDGVQLWADGPYWAECNVGATRPEEYGYYFWWGDTVGYKRNVNNDGWVSALDDLSGIDFADHGASAVTYLNDNAWLQSKGYIDGSGTLTSQHDAATVHCGIPWRMPTNAEIDALCDTTKTKTTWTTRNGVYGRLIEGVTAGYVGKSIFIPAAGRGNGSDLQFKDSDGYFWSSMEFSLGYHSRVLSFDSNSISSQYGNSRYFGIPVRPVR